MSDLTDIANFWLYINTDKTVDGLTFEFDFVTKKFLHILSRYPNEFWKYIITVYFYKHKQDTDFVKTFNIFLHKLTAFLYVKFIEKPTVNAIKDDIYQKYISVFHDSDTNFTLNIDKTILEPRISEFASSRLSSSLILLQCILKSKTNCFNPKNI